MALNTWNRLVDPAREYPSDSTLVSGVRKGDVEQKFATWCQILDAAGNKTAHKAVNKLFDAALACEKANASSNVFETFVELVEKYLFDPNSPYRNEDYYGLYADRLAKYPGLSAEMQDKYARDAGLCALNRVGTKATDFRFADRRGKMHSLYGIKAPHTLLFFSNPGCEACMNIINVLKGEPRIAQMIASGQLAVLNIYIDEDLEAWRSYMPIYPDEWYNGFDPDFAIRNEELYNVRAIPSLYLLDAEKTVILKDAPENKVFDYLVRIQ
ncbi:MAG: DUF5106 domain-containing protein [Bacteroidales bacterium]|nr:DUF5106 domain-containing protein [Bacteroidales bacterium]